MKCVRAVISMSEAMSTKSQRCAVSAPANEQYRRAFPNLCYSRSIYLDRVFPLFNVLPGHLRQ